VNFAQSDSHHFQNDFSKDLPAASVRKLDSVEAVGRGPLRRGAGFLRESFVTDGEAQKFPASSRHWRLKLEQLISSRGKVSGTPIWITDNWSCGYYHWMLEALTRLEFASRSCDLSELTLLLPYKFRRHQFMLDSLQIYNLKGVQFLKRFERIRCEEMVLPQHTAPSGNHDESIVAGLRQRILQHFNLQPQPHGATPKGNRIYISRRLAGVRRIRNERDLSFVLRNHGFETFVAEEHDWATQMETAANAGYMISNHGGGMANAFMMQPGSRLLEMRAESGYMPNCFYTLASAANLPFYYLLCELVSHKDTAHRTDLIVDPSSLDYVLDEMTNTTHKEIQANRQLAA